MSYNPVDDLKERGRKRMEELGLTGKPPVTAPVPMSPRYSLHYALNGKAVTQEFGPRLYLASRTADKLYQSGHAQQIRVVVDNRADIPVAYTPGGRRDS